jgi:beta-lactamase regulating signal transducer with metallopeptidase domain
MSASLAFRGVASLGEWVLIATVILSVAWLMTLRIRRNAAMRHLTWLTAFLSLLLTPALVSVMPTRFSVQMPIAVSSLATSSAEKIPFADATRVEGDGHAGAPRSRGRGIQIATLLLGLWLVGVGVVAILGALAAYAIRIMRRHSTEHTIYSLDLPQLSAKVNLKRNWELRISSTQNPPTAMTWGFIRPVILLPKDSLLWTRNQLEAVLLHELAHVRRLDTLSQWLTIAVCALFWFHPAVWWSARIMRAEAELAADDAVLISGAAPSAYAAELLRFAAELGQRRQPFAYLGVSLMRQSRIEIRIESILNADHREREVNSMQALRVLALGFSTVLLLASLRPSVSLANERHAAVVYSPATTKFESPHDPQAQAIDETIPPRRTRAKTDEAAVKKQLDVAAAQEQMGAWPPKVKAAQAVATQERSRAVEARRPLADIIPPRAKAVDAVAAQERIDPVEAVKQSSRIVPVRAKAAEAVKQPEE